APMQDHPLAASTASSTLTTRPGRIGTRTRRAALAAAVAGVAIAGLLLPGSVSAQDDAQNRPHAGMLRFPDVSADSIVFSYGNDLWVVSRDGGTARPLASPPGLESNPKF